MTRAAGMVNAHTHMYSALAPLGMPEPERTPENFLQILERVWWKLDRALDAASLRASARLYVGEALLHGTTTLVDHHESPGMIEGSLDILADACQELGIRAVLCYGATERNAGSDEAWDGLVECRRFITSNERPNVRGVIGLHASFTVSDDTLHEAGEMARSLNTVCHVHVAEAEADMEDARERGYRDPLDRLQARGALPPGSLLAHAVHLDEAAVREAASHGHWFMQNPRSNAGNRVGYPRALWASRQIALGTDGYPADMPAELAALERIVEANPEVESASQKDRRARLAAGMRLAAEQFDHPGALDTDFVEMEPPASGQPTRAQHVTVAGELVVVNGELTRGDIEEIRAEARGQAPRVWSRLREIA